MTWAIRSYTGDKRAEEIRKNILEYRKALDVVDSSIAHSETPGKLIEAQITIAIKKFDVGMHQEAREALEKARIALKNVAPSEAKSTDSRISRLMGRALSATGKTLDESIIEYQRSIATGIESGEHYEVALSWNGIGSISWRLGQFQKALECYNKALKSLESMETKSKNDKNRKQSAEALLKSGLGNVYLDLLDFDAAIRYNEEAIETFRVMGNNAEMGRIYNNLARVYEEMGNYPKAIDRYERAIKYISESGSMRMQGWALTNLASTLVEHGNVDDARQHLEKAEKILSNFSDSVAQSKLHCMWGKYCREKRDWSNGIEHFQKSIAALDNVKTPDYLALAQEEFGILYLKKGDKAKAIVFLRPAIEWYREKKDGARISKLEKLLPELKN